MAGTGATFNLTWLPDVTAGAIVAGQKLVSGTRHNAPELRSPRFRRDMDAERIGHYREYAGDDHREQLARCGSHIQQRERTGLHSTDHTQRLIVQYGPYRSHYP